MTYSDRAIRQIPERQHSLTDLLTLLTIMVSKQPGGQVYITQEEIQDYAQLQLFLESSYDTNNLSLSTRRGKML